MSFQCLGKCFISRSYNLSKKSENIFLHRQTVYNQIRILSLNVPEGKTDITPKLEAAKQTSLNLLLKPPKGTRDFNGVEMLMRRKVFEKFYDIFQMHGAVEIETPVFELREVLTGKYGEDSKLIYDLDDQGGEMLSMRYDLTVPFARYLAGNKLSKIKRYTIARVYRRDAPAISKGRYREFYQCDFDIAGKTDIMIADSECIHVVDQVLKKLDLGKYIIKVNHKKILDGIFTLCGVPSNKFRQICSAIDKLDKMGWAKVKNEIVEEKGLPPDVADKIGEYVKLTGGVELLNKMQNDSGLKTSLIIQEGVKELLLLYEYCCALSCEQNIQFDMALARGLDYYTGVIFEAILHECSPTTADKGVGSVAGGGRYDELVSMLSQKGHCVPCVGVSFGIERIITIQERKERNLKAKLKSTHTQVLVCSPCKNFLKKRLNLVNKLHENGINAETMSKVNPRLLDQFCYADNTGIPLVLLTGEDEELKKVVKLRTMSDRKEEILSEDAFIDKILAKINGLKVS